MKAVVSSNANLRLYNVQLSTRRWPIGFYCLFALLAIRNSTHVCLTGFSWGGGVHRSPPVGPTLVDPCPTGAPGLVRLANWAPTGRGFPSLGPTVDPYGPLPTRIQSSIHGFNVRLIAMSLKTAEVGESVNNLFACKPTNQGWTTLFWHTVSIVSWHVIAIRPRRAVGRGIPGCAKKKTNDFSMS